MDESHWTTPVGESNRYPIDDHSINVTQTNKHVMIFSHLLLCKSLKFFYIEWNNILCYFDISGILIVTALGIALGLLLGVLLLAIAVFFIKRSVSLFF